MTLKLELHSAPLPGLYVLNMPRHRDERGTFTKTFNEKQLEECGLDFSIAEHFYSVSHPNVLRGMHFQVGNAAHAKLVFCTRGSILDVVVDVRKDSHNYNKPFSIELSPVQGKALLIDKGYAHGFLTLAENTEVHYFTSHVHTPEHDRGVLWSSICFEWPSSSPILSDRDRSHPKIGEVECEFF